MAIAIISDIHIKTPGDERELLFLSFLNHIELDSVDEIYLLGDIFDLVIGNHIEYFELYRETFEKLKSLINKGIKFHYFEGNHDFHLEDLFNKFQKLNDLPSESITIHKKEFFKKIDSNLCRFSHGDDIEIGNHSYKLYKWFITSKPLNLIANYIMPFKLLNAIGENASKASRERNTKKYSDIKSNDRVKDLFRQATERSFKRKSFNYIFCGHSHVREEYNSALGYTYFNVGYLPIQKEFIILKNDTVKFVSL